MFDKDFKFTQTMRVNLGFDFNLLGIEWTAEGIFSKSLNDVFTRTWLMRSLVRPCLKPLT